MHTITSAWPELLGQFFGHVKAIAVLPGGTQKRRVERIDRSLAVQLREATGLQCAVEIAQQHHRPVGAAGVLTVRVVAGVDDQRVVHHRATSFGHTFQRFHDPHQHAAVVLTDLDPDRIVGLLHVSQVVTLLLDADSLPRPEDLAAT